MLAVKAIQPQVMDVQKCHLLNRICLSLPVIIDVQNMAHLNAFQRSRLIAHWLAFSLLYFLFIKNFKKFQKVYKNFCVWFIAF